MLLRSGYLVHYFDSTTGGYDPRCFMKPAHEQRVPKSYFMLNDRSFVRGSRHKGWGGILSSFSDTLQQSRKKSRRRKRRWWQQQQQRQKRERQVCRLRLRPVRAAPSLPCSLRVSR